MAFWGVEVKGGSSYTHSFDRDQGRLHLSQATLGSGSSNKKSILQCTVGDKKPIYLCSLFPEKLETCQLSHEFEEEDDVVFSVIGPHSVHLSGFFFGESHDCGEDHYGSDSSGEDIANTDSEYSDFDSDDEDEDEDDDPFFTDDLDMSPSPVPNSGVVIEEIVEDDKPAAEVASKKGKKKKKSGTSDVNGNSDRQIVLKNTAGGSILESEDEDGFPVSSAPKNKADAPEAKKTKEIEDKKAKDESRQGRSLKRKVDAVVQDDEESRLEDLSTPLKPNEKSSLADPEAVLETDVKQKKGKKNKKLKGKDENSNNPPESANVKPTQPQDNDQKIATDKNGEIQADSVVEGAKKKNNKKNKKKGNETDAAVQPTATEQKGAVNVKNDNKEAEPFQVRSFPNGLTIEELKMGKPDGKKAAPGKKVSVHYIGKLKKTGKIFDSNIGKSPFKFRLGVGQVIKGWDVGVNGMRVGDKRRITIPPAMGYGAGGAGAAIPPNSWLVFDVELVGVN